MSVAVYLMDFAKWMKNTTAVGVIKISYAALKRYGMFFVIQVPHCTPIKFACSEKMY